MREEDEVAAETDADLLVYMSMAGDEPAAARAAWAEFYRRHVRYLFVVCQRSYGELLGGEQGVADLVAEALRRAYERAETFDAGGVTDAEAQLRMVRAWLGRIAQRLAQDLLRGRGRTAASHLSTEQWQQIAQQAEQREGTFEEPAGPQDEGELAAVREALEALSQREQLVLRVTMQWYRPDAVNQRLPDQVCHDLATTLGTTPENLRQIRRRALAKVRDHVLKRMRQAEHGSRKEAL